MKYSIALLFTIIAWFSTCVLAQTYKPPADQLIREKLNLNMPEFIKMCSAHPGVINVETKDRFIATKNANALSDELVKRAKTSPKVDETTWDQLIEDHCLGDVVLQTLNESNVDDINLCLNEKQKLKGEKKTDFTNALLKAYCAEVNRLAKEKYAADKN